MVATASFVISIIALVGALATAFLGYLNYHTDYLKRQSESRKITPKYKDPLLLPTVGLQSRIHNILSKKWPGMLVYDGSDPNKQWVYCTFYFLCFPVPEKNEKPAIRLNRIRDVVARSDYYQFMLWRGQQMVIGEFMTENIDAESHSMGYSTFVEKYDTDTRFRMWFWPIEAGIAELAAAYREKRQDPARIPEARLSHLQHLLLDLIDILEPERVRLVGLDCNPCEPAEETCIERLSISAWDICHYRRGVLKAAAVQNLTMNIVH